MGSNADAEINSDDYSGDVRKGMTIDPFITQVDEGATYTYIGKAVPGTATSEAKWQIKRVTNASGVTLYADGDIKFDNVYDNRTTLSYS